MQGRLRTEMRLLSHQSPCKPRRGQRTSTALGNAHLLSYKFRTWRVQLNVVQPPHGVPMAYSPDQNQTVTLREVGNTIAGLLRGGKYSHCGCFIASYCGKAQEIHPLAWFSVKQGGIVPNASCEAALLALNVTYDGSSTFPFSNWVNLRYPCFGAIAWQAWQYSGPRRRCAEIDT
eukprot:5178833-Amphidinium_carterae.2